jgi:hypothetical protein
MATYTIDPTSDAKQQWTATFPTSGQTAWSNTNKAVRQPTAPSTSSGVDDTAAAGHLLECQFPLTLGTNEEITGFTLWVYGSCTVAGGSSAGCSVQLPNGTAAYLPTTAGWVSSTVSDTSGAITPPLTAVATATTGTSNIYSWYVVVTTIITTPQSLTASSFAKGAALNKTAAPSRVLPTSRAVSLAQATATYYAVATGFPVETSGGGNRTVSVTPAHVGDLIVVHGSTANASQTVTTVSGGGVTWSKAVDGNDGTGIYSFIWWGVAASTAAFTLTVTTATVDASSDLELWVNSYTAAGASVQPTWYLGVTGGVVGNPGSTSNQYWPSLTATDATSLYSGWNYIYSSYGGGSITTSGITYDPTADGNEGCYALAPPQGTPTSPVSNPGSSVEGYSVAAIFTTTPSSSTVLLTATAIATSKSLSVPSAATSTSTSAYGVSQSVSVVHALSRLAPSAFGVARATDVVTANPSTGSLTDPFTAVNSAIWNSYKTGNPAAPSMSGGILSVPNGTASADQSNIQSQAAYSLTGSTLACKITPGTDTNGAQNFQLVNSSTGLTLSWIYTGGTWQATCSTVSGAMFANPLTPAYAWLRFREAAGIVYWEASPDGITWTTIAQVSVGAGACTSMTVQWRTYVYGTITGSTPMQVSNLNVTPTGAGVQPSFQNLILNPSFEYDATGSSTPAAWGTNGWGETLSVVASGGVASGSKALQEAWVTTNAGGGSYPGVNLSVPLVGGVTYMVRLALSVLTNSYGAVPSLQIGCYNASSTFLGNVGCGYSSSPWPAGTSGVLTGFFTAPAGSATGVWQIFFGDYSTGSTDRLTYVIDAVQIAPGAIGQPYGDGDTAGWGWNGAPGDALSALATPVSNLVDAFPGPGIDSQFTLNDTGSPSDTITISNGLTIPLTTDYPGVLSALSAYPAPNVYGLLGSSIFVQITPPSVGNGSKYVGLELDCIQGGNLGFQWQDNGGASWQPYWTDASNGAHYLSQVNLGSVPTWVRIRESAGTVYWDYTTATTPTGWTNLGSLADSTFGFSLSALYVKIAAGYYGTESPSSALVQSLNGSSTSQLLTVYAYGMAAVQDTVSAPTQVTPSSHGASQSLSSLAAPSSVVVTAYGAARSLGATIASSLLAAMALGSSQSSSSTTSSTSLSPAAYGVSQATELLVSSSVPFLTSQAYATSLSGATTNAAVSATTTAYAQSQSTGATNAPVQAAPQSRAQSQSASQTLAITNLTPVAYGATLAFDTVTANTVQFVGPVAFSASQASSNTSYPRPLATSAFASSQAGGLATAPSGLVPQALTIGQAVSATTAPGNVQVLAYAVSSVQDVLAATTGLSPAARVAALSLAMGTAATPLSASSSAASHALGLASAPSAVTVMSQSASLSSESVGVIVVFTPGASAQTSMTTFIVILENHLILDVDGGVINVYFEYDEPAATADSQEDFPTAATLGALTVTWEEYDEPAATADSQEDFPTAATLGALTVTWEE